MLKRANSAGQGAEANAQPTVQAEAVPTVQAEAVAAEARFNSAVEAAGAPPPVRAEPVEAKARRGPRLLINLCENLGHPPH